VLHLLSLPCSCYDRRITGAEKGADRAGRGTADVGQQDGRAGRGVEEERVDVKMFGNTSYKSEKQRRTTQKTRTDGKGGKLRVKRGQSKNQVNMGKMKRNM